MSAYRFSWLRANGWTRMGVVGAIVMVFAVPMMWALGVFGSGDSSLGLAGVFLFSSLWFFVALGYGIGWVVRGFTVRLKGDDDEDQQHHADRPHPPHPPQPHR